jgi:Na+-transporting NADH:ubiquinone oxidoreductase subunit B
LNHSATGYRDLSFALIPPLLVRLAYDGNESALARLDLLALAFVVAHAWRAAFAGGRLWLVPNASQFSFALLFIVMLPAPAGWGGTLLATSFGWVFAREIFGGKSILSPALVALVFAIFSFPQAGYEARSILAAQTNTTLALACLPGAAWLLWRRFLSWQTIAAALIGATAALILVSVPGSPSWWEHFLLGGFVPGIVFLAAAPGSAPRIAAARWLHGVLVGALIVVIRLFDPAQPDGIVFAVFIGALFAPLMERGLNWRPHREWR